MIKNIYDKWQELESKIPLEGNCVYEYYLSKKANNKMYFGIDSNKTKKIYIEFDAEVIRKYKLPEILGMKISRINASYIDPNKAYISIENESDTDEVFLAFNATLVDKLHESKSSANTIECLESTIKYYKDFFSNPNKKLSDSEEQGLCGELILLKELIETQGQESVLHWLGPNKNKCDFVFDTKAIEVKSTLNQAETSITVSSENQLDNSNIDNLYLVVYVLEKDPNGDINVINCANSVLELLTDVQCNKVFVSKLLQMNVNLHTYKYNNSYTIQNIKKYLISDDFPCLNKKNIPSIIFNVKYKINLNSLDSFLVDGV